MNHLWFDFGLVRASIYLVKEVGMWVHKHTVSRLTTLNFLAFLVSKGSFCGAFGQKNLPPRNINWRKKPLTREKRCRNENNVSFWRRNGDFVGRYHIITTSHFLLSGSQKGLKSWHSGIFYWLKYFISFSRTFALMHFFIGTSTICSLTFHW